MPESCSSHLLSQIVMGSPCGVGSGSQPAAYEENPTCHLGFVFGGVSEPGCGFTEQP